MAYICWSVATIVFGTVPVMALTVARGTQALDVGRIRLLKIFGARRLVVGIALVLDALPAYFLGARLAFAIALVISVVSEMVFRPGSGLAIGALSKDYQMNFETPRIYACVILVGLVGYVGNLLLRLLEDYLRGGHQGAGAEDRA